MIKQVLESRILPNWIIINRCTHMRYNYFPLHLNIFGTVNLFNKTQNLNKIFFFFLPHKYCFSILYLYAFCYTYMRKCIRKDDFCNDPITA